MTQYDDTQLVDYLFDEMSEEDARAFEQAMSEDAALSAEVDALEATLGVMRELEDAEPPPHLDALILATARQTAEAVQAEREEASWLGRLRKMILTPAFGLAAAASLAVVLMVSVGTQSFLAEPQDASEAVPPGFGASAKAPAEAPVAASAEAPDDDLADEELAAADAELQQQYDGAKRGLEEAKEDESAEFQDKLAKRLDAPKAKPTVRRSRRARPVPPPPAINEAESRVGDLAPAKERTFAKKDTSTLRAAPEGSASGGGVADLRAGSAASGPTRQAVTKTEATSDDAFARREVVQVEKKKAARAAPAPVATDAPAAAPEPEPTPPRDEAPRADKEALDADGDDRASEAERAVQLASAMVKAAEQEIAREQYDSARRIFGRAVQRVRGTPSEGEVLLRWAYFERDQRRFEVCVSLADRASRVPGFTRRAEAERLVRDASRRIEPQVAPSAPASAPPRR